MALCLRVSMAIFSSLCCSSALSSTQHIRRANDMRHAVRLTLDSGAHAITEGGNIAKTCDEVNERRFAFSDKAACGSDPIEYTMQDCMDAYQVEQNYWSQQGSQNPWWAVDTNQPLGADLPLEKKLAFYKSGADEALGQVSSFEKQGLKDSLVPAQKSVALDFGCGLGRMGNGLVNLGFAKVLCVDQAQTMLDAAKKNLGELAGQGVVPLDVLDRIDFVQSPPTLMCNVPPGTVDYVHSVITLQHMKPQLQVAYVEQMCDTLRIGGSGFFQIPVSSSREEHDSHCVLKTEKFVMAMHYTPKEEVVRHLEARGCKVLLTIPYPAIGDWGVSLGFGFRKETNSVFLLR